MVIIFITVITLLSPLVVWGTYELAFRNKIYPGVRVASEKFPPKADRPMAEKVKSSKLIKLTAGNKEWTASGEDLGVEIDQEETRKKLMAVGRSGNLTDNIQTKIKAYRYGWEVEPVITYQRGNLEELADRIGEELYIAAIEPKFRLAGGRVIEFQIGKEGQKADIKTLKNLIIESIYADGDQNIEVPINIIKPTAQETNQTAEEMGIKQLLGTGNSMFKGSISARKHNVLLTAEKLDGILIAPGTEFSFNNVVGDISKETGFQSAYIIQDGRTVLGDGGGVCQASTTLFRATMKAGLPIVERKAHSYRVGYYEQNSAAGMDATVFSPTTDFRFKNDTPAHLLIQTKANGVDNTLTIEIWGTGDERTATISKPIITDQTPPPPDLYQDDPTLKMGVIKQVDWKAWGAKVKFDYTVARNGETIFKKTYFSNYQPWQNVYLRGTAAQ